MTVTECLTLAAGDEVPMCLHNGQIVAVVGLVAVVCGLASVFKLGVKNILKSSNDEDR